MNSRFCVVSALVVSSSLVSAGFASAQSASQSQNVTLNEKVKIPGASLKPGDYTFSVEDRLEDRAIVRITAQDQSKHYLVLTVPSAKLPQAGNDGLVRFNVNGKDQALRGWACSGCTPGLEFVYPKAEAAKLTDQTAEPVLAVDPTYDKLPANLSADDMKVVTLWLLSPEQLTANNRGKGVKAEKYASTVQPVAPAQTAALPEKSAPVEAPPPVQAATPAAVATAEVAKPADSAMPAPQTPAPAPVAEATVTNPAPHAQTVATPATEHATQPTEIASAAPARSSLPKTASSNYLYLLSGFLLMFAALGVRLSRRFAFSK